MGEMPSVRVFGEAKTSTAVLKYRGLSSTRLHSKYSRGRQKTSVFVGFTYWYLAH